MHWYCRVYDEDDEWTAYCVWAASEYRATVRLANYILDVEGYTASGIECEMWNTFEHGDINDYEILS
jgi:hypothetical protein